MLAAAKVYIGLRDDRARRFWSRSHGGRCLVVVGSVLAEACFGALMIVLTAALLTLVYSPPVVVFLSMQRLGENSYGNAGGDAAKANAAKLKASLQIFYSLALTQSIVSWFWIMLVYIKYYRSSVVSRQCGFGEWGRILVRRYRHEIEAICAKEGYLPRSKNLIVFAVKLLGSESMDDRRSAVRLLDTFVGNKIPVWPILLPCKGQLENLMEALEVGNNSETRERAARIVGALAGDLRHIDQFPTALHNIASLLQASSEQKQVHSSDQLLTAYGSGFTYAATATSMLRKRRWWYGPLYWGAVLVSSFSISVEKEQKGEPQLLISQGLLIIERLAQHQGNCEHICSNQGLVSKITAPLTNSHAFLDAEYDSQWTDILSRSMRIVARLISAPGEASRGLRHGIASKAQAIDNLTKILEDNRFGPVLKTAAIEILAELAPDKSVTSLGKDGTKKFITKLWGIFLGGMTQGSSTGESIQQEAANRLRHKAGQALAKMLYAWDIAGSSSSSDVMEMFIQSTGSAEYEQTEELCRVFGKLTDMLIANRASRTRAAEILLCLCSHFTTELLRQDVTKIMLEKVLHLVICIPTEANNGSNGVEANNGSNGVGANNGSSGVGANSGNDVPTDPENPRPEDHAHAGSGNEEQHEEKEFLVALLSLAVAICDRKMVDEQDVTCDMESLVTKLKRIIETNHGATVECLRIVKLSCQLVISVVQLKPNCIKIFTEQKFKDVLSESLSSLSNLDNCMLFDANYHQVTRTSKPLASLVKKAQELLDKGQEQGNGHA